MREFSPGQEVLLLLPSSSNAPETKWQGPFKVNRKVGPVDYEIETNHKGRKLKVYYVNLLKKFKRRTMESSLGATNVTGDEQGENHPVLYLSRKLLPREQNYTTIEKECLVIRWAICSLQYYLLGSKFKVITDHQPLSWLNEMR